MHFKIRHGLILVSAVCLISAVPAQARTAYKTTAKTVCLTKTSVHMRKGPGLNYPVQTTIRKGARVKKIGASGSWTAVKTNGSVSYIKSRYLKKLYKVIYVSGDGVNLRTGPGTGYSSIAVVPQNTRLKCLGKHAGWAKVKYEKRTCYISSALTSTRKTASASGSPASSTSTGSAAGSQSADAIRSKAIFAARARLGVSLQPVQTEFSWLCRLLQSSARRFSICFRHQYRRNHQRTNRQTYRLQETALRSSGRRYPYAD